MDFNLAIQCMRTCYGRVKFLFLNSYEGNLKNLISTDGQVCKEPGIRILRPLY